MRDFTVIILVLRKIFINCGIDELTAYSMIDIINMTANPVLYFHSYNKMFPKILAWSPEFFVDTVKG